jgi:hypothetical protein
MAWKRGELFAQGKDDAGEFECRQSRFDIVTETETVPVRNSKGEIEGKERVTVSLVGGTIDVAAKSATLPARPGWPSAPFSMVKAVAVAKDGTETVLFEKVPAE